MLTLKFDGGIPIVPAHALSQQADIYNFNGGLDLPHSGPYNLVAWDSKRKVFDLRPDWWAVQAGLIKMPAVERVVIVNIFPQSMDEIAARVASGELLSEIVRVLAHDQTPKAGATGVPW